MARQMAGASLPDGAEVVGLVTESDDCYCRNGAALVRMPTGIYVTMIDGVMRSVDQSIAGRVAESGAMDEATFKSELTKADTMREIGAEPGADYWRGYMRGLRRGYHGEIFGTAKEHEQHLALAESEDDSRGEIGRGYRDGLAKATA